MNRRRFLLKSVGATLALPSLPSLMASAAGGNSALQTAKGAGAEARRFVAIGEIGLGGELRQAGQTPRRLAEAARLGFARAVVPTSTPEVEGITLLRVGSVVEALDAAGLLGEHG